MKKKVEEKRFNRKTKFKKGQLVRDRWFPEMSYGRIEQVLKTRIKVNFGGSLITIDCYHYQFLIKA